MSRKIIKTVSNVEIKYIPEDMKDLKENAEKMFDRPLIIYGKRLTNTQKWEMRQLMGGMNKYNTMAEGTGEALEYVWKTCVTKVCNMVMEVEGKTEEYAELTGAEKDELWNTTKGMEDVLFGAVAFFQDESELDEEEVKTSV